MEILKNEDGKYISIVLFLAHVFDKAKEKLLFAPEKQITSLREEKQSAI